MSKRYVQRVAALVVLMTVVLASVFVLSAACAHRRGPSVPDVVRVAQRLTPGETARACVLDAVKLAMRSTKAVARADIARFERDQSAQAPASTVTEWLTSLLRRYQAWLTRLSPP